MIVLALLVGCTGPSSGTTFSGTKISEYFPMDGDRAAFYFNEDTENVAWTLRVEKIDPSIMVGDLEVVTFEHSVDDDGTVLGQVQWSSRAGEGVKIHGYAEGTNALVTLDPPIDVSDPNDNMFRNDVVTTETNGTTYTSTFVGMEDCPVQWGIDNWECVHLRLDDGDGDDAAGLFFVGDYWLVTRYGPAWMKLTGNSQKWNLKDYDWDSGGA